MWLLKGGATSPLTIRKKIPIIPLKKLVKPDDQYSLKLDKKKCASKIAHPALWIHWNILS